VGKKKIAGWIAESLPEPFFSNEKRHKFSRFPKEKGGTWYLRKRYAAKNKPF